MIPLFNPVRAALHFKYMLSRAEAESNHNDFISYIHFCRMMREDIELQIPLILSEFPRFFKTLTGVPTDKVDNASNESNEFKKCTIDAYSYAFFCIAGKQFKENLIWDEKDYEYLNFFNTYHNEVCRHAYNNLRELASAISCRMEVENTDNDYDFTPMDCYKSLEGIYCDIVMEQLKKAMSEF